MGRKPCFKVSSQFIFIREKRKRSKSGKLDNVWLEKCGLQRQILLFCQCRWPPHTCMEAERPAVKSCICYWPAHCLHRVSSSIALVALQSTKTDIIVAATSEGNIFLFCICNHLFIYTNTMHVPSVMVGTHFFQGVYIYFWKQCLFRFLMH